MDVDITSRCNLVERDDAMLLVMTGMGLVQILDVFCRYELRLCATDVRGVGSHHVVTVWCLLEIIARQHVLLRGENARL